MVKYDKCDLVAAVLLMNLFGFIAICCAGTMVLSAIWGNPILFLCMAFFMVWFVKYTYKKYKAVIFLFDNVK